MNPLRLIVLKARDILGLPSMQEIFPGVYAGDFGDVYRVKDLSVRNIQFILNVADEKNDPDLSKYAAFTQAKCGLEDWNSPRNEANVLAALNKLDRWYGECISVTVKLKPIVAILVHCEGGRNRTLYVLARWWARRTGRNWREVADEIIAKRPEMALHPWMIKQGPK